MNSEKILSNLLKINYGINNDTFKTTKFIDEKLEEKFKQENFKNSSNHDFVSNLIIILGYIASYLYIIYAFYRLVFIFTCSLCFIFSVFSLIFSLHFKNYRAKNINDHVQIFLQSIFLVSKGIIVCMYYNSNTNDNHQEIVRIIIYNFISNNIYIITKLDSNFIVFLFYYLQNFIIIIFGSFYSNKNNFYYLEGVTSFFVSVIFYFLRKEWDYKIRLIFAEKNKFQNYFIYTQDFLNGLNGFNLTIKNKNNIFYNEKFISFLDKLYERNYISQNLDDSELNELKSTDFSFNKLEDNFDNQKSECKKRIKTFMKKLVFYDYIEKGKDVIFHKDLNETFGSRNILDNKIQEITLYDIIKDSDFFNSQEEINELNFKNQEITVNNFNNSKDILKLNYNHNNFNFSNKKINFKKKNLSNLKSLQHLKHSEKSEPPLNSKQKSFQYTKSDKFQDILNNLKLPNKSFKNLGIFFINHKSKNVEATKIYFNLYYRKTNLEVNSNILEDIFFYDVSDLINSKNKILENQTKNHKIFTKIAHEFKTSFNSILGIIKNVKRSDIIMTKSTTRELDKVFNLSNYLIFLTSDIIQFVNFTDTKESIKINNSPVNIRQILEFCYEILNSLLTFNKNKYEKIIPFLKICEEIEYFEISTDEVKIKQVLLNFVSNSVKFTNEGKIILKCKKISIDKQNYIQLSVKDTGLGIEEKSDNKNKPIDIFESGMGLRICKVLVDSLKGKIVYKSSYLKGSTFSVMLPVDVQETSEISRNDSLNKNLLENNSLCYNNLVKKKVKFLADSYINNLHDIVSESSTIIRKNKMFTKSEISKKNSDIREKIYYSSKELGKNFNLLDNVHFPSFQTMNIGFEIDSNNKSTVIINDSYLSKKFFIPKIYFISEIDQDNSSYFLKSKFHNIKTSINQSTRSCNIPTIMLVDDNEIINQSNKNLITEILKENILNYTITLGTDGLDIIRLVLNYEFNYSNIKCIITDENMDFFSGSDAICFVRKFERVKGLKKVKIISSTCHEDNSIVNHILNSGADKVISKPISKKQMKELLIEREIY